MVATKDLPALVVEAVSQQELLDMDCSWSKGWLVLLCSDYCILLQREGKFIPKVHYLCVHSDCVLCCVHDHAPTCGVFYVFWQPLRYVYVVYVTFKVMELVGIPIVGVIQSLGL